VQLHRWGLLERIVSAGTPPVQRTTFRYAGDEVTIAIKPSHGVDALYAPRRTVLDPVLVDAAVEAGAVVRFGVSVTGVRRDQQGRVVGIDARDNDGRRFAVDSRIVIGADGRRSTIAHHAGAAIERLGTGASSVVYGYWADVDTDGYEWIFRRDACAGLIPTNGGLTCVFVSATPERIRRGGTTVLESVMEQASPSTAARIRGGRVAQGVRTFLGQPGFMRRAWGPGWALVGDAGYWKDPLSAHGLTDALRDAELLARAVVEGVGGRSEDETLARYQEMRDRLSLPLFTVVDEIANQRWDDREIGPLLMQLSAAMADEVDEVAALDTLAVP
jgi:2-polyprenyl-6-methoxyphenol hydroxylase-like FAD-dependent oxidoreductase